MARARQSASCITTSVKLRSATVCFSVEPQITREELRVLQERQRQMDRREIERFESEGGAMFIDAFRFPSAEALLALRAERELAKKDR